MKTLLLLRHAKSSWTDSSLDDRDRPLNKRGRKAAPLMGRVILAGDLIPDLILCSTALRARETLQRVLSEWSRTPEIQLREELYHAQPSQLLSVLARVPDQHQRVLLIGHNPGLEEFLTLLTAQTEPLPTAALARIDLTVESWSHLTNSTPDQSSPRKGTLIQIWRPRDLE